MDHPSRLKSISAFSSRSSARPSGYYAAGYDYGYDAYNAPVDPNYPVGYDYYSYPPAADYSYPPPPSTAAPAASAAPPRGPPSSSASLSSNVPPAGYEYDTGYPAGYGYYPPPSSYSQESFRDAYPSSGGDRRVGREARPSRGGGSSGSGYGPIKKHGGPRDSRGHYPYR